MTNSPKAAAAASAPPQGKRERLVTAACDLVYRQGVSRTTLADIAAAADVPLGNVYYYFKTKDDIVDAVLNTHAERLRAGVLALEQRHRSPKARLRALMGVLAERRDLIAQYGCRYGTLCGELAKAPGKAPESDPEASPRAAPLIQIPLEWAEQQFRAMGRRDAHDLAVELVASYQGSALLSSTFGQPELMARQTRRLERWIDSLRPDRKGTST